MNNAPRTQEQIRTIQDLQKQQHERNLADLRWVLSRPAGRRVIWWIIADLCSLFLNEFTGSSRDIYANGKRSVGAALHARILEATGGFKILDRMLKEANQDKATEASIKQAILAEEEERNGR